MPRCVRSTLKALFERLETQRTALEDAAAERAELKMAVDKAR